MSYDYEIQDAYDLFNSFSNEDEMYKYLLKLHKEIEITDVSDLLDLLLKNHQFDQYKTLQRFVENEIKA